METFSAQLAISAENSPVPREFPAQRPVTWSFDVFFDLRLNKRLSNREAGDLRRYRAHSDVIVMFIWFFGCQISQILTAYHCQNMEYLPCQLHNNIHCHGVDSYGVEKMIHYPLLYNKCSLTFWFSYHYVNQNLLLIKCVIFALSSFLENESGSIYVYGH